MNGTLVVRNGRIDGIGAISRVLVRVLVQDIVDKPMSRIPVMVRQSGSNIGEGMTNGNGTVVIPVNPIDLQQPIAVYATLPEGEVMRSIPAEAREVVAFRSVERNPYSLVTTTEAIGILGGAAIFGIGMSAKVRPLELFGEILFIAGVFARIGRG